MIHVRNARPADVPWLVQQLTTFGHLYGTRIPMCPDDPAMAAHIVSGMIEHHVVLIAERGDKPLGLLAAYYAPHPYNPLGIRALTEAWYWVDPYERFGRAGLKLLDAFDAIATANADHATFGMVEGLTKMNPHHLERRGYRLHERSYLREVH